MSSLRELKYHEIITRLKRHGFRFYRKGKGSHELWVRDSDGLAVPVPKHKGRAVRKGTIAAIIKEIGVSVDDFMN